MEYRHFVYAKKGEKFHRRLTLILVVWLDLVMTLATHTDTLTPETLTPGVRLGF
jgi:hypothetical protein